MSTILIAGGTGLIGSRLSQLLTQQGHEVHHLSRSVDADAPYATHQWDLKKGTIDSAALKKADYVLNFAGAGIADKRWSDERKKLIIASRVAGNELFARQLPKYPNVKAYISASAIGYYGDRGNELLTESSAPGQEDFLAESCKLWEGAVGKVTATGIRTAIIRIGIVLSTKGGALEKMLIPFNFSLGTYFGDGTQIYSWIHIDDLCWIFIKAIEDENIKGIYNGVAPHPLSNKLFTKKTGDALDKSAILLPAPTFALRLAMGEMADVVLSGSNVSSDKIEATGFEFQFPELEAAIRDLRKRKI